MNIHRRWKCGECKREWIEPKYFVNSSPMTITGNKRDDLCPMCGSGSIEFVEYMPLFNGGDIPRPDVVVNIPPGADLGSDQKEAETIGNTLGFIQGRVIE